MDTISNSNDSWWKFWRRRRHVVALLAFFGFFNVYSLRVNLSVAIVAMTSPRTKILNNATIMEEPELPWDSRVQGVVLSSFFYGYIWTQLLGGWLAARFGGARIYCFGIASTAICTLISPPIINLSVYSFIGLRILEGLFEGVTYPCIHAVWSKWAPVSERAAMATFAFSGSYLGTVITLPVSGYLAKSLGWPSIFYFTGCVGIIWCVSWITIVKDNPEDDPKISKEELQFLKEESGAGQPNVHTGHPWKEMFKSLPLWAIVCAHFCENWGFYTLLTQLPTFMKDTLDFDIRKAGVLSSLPYLVMTIMLQFAGKLADILCNRNVFSRTNVRKLFNCGAFLCQTVFMLMAGYLSSSTGVLTCLVLAVGFGAFAWPAFSVNPLDLAPRHASIILGISNTFATLPGIISPLLTGFIVTNKSQSEWRLVFFISSAIYLVGAIFYGTFASAELQPWANSSPVKDLPPEQNIPMETESGSIKKEDNSTNRGIVNMSIVNDE